MVAPDQLIDWTRRGPPATFFGDGVAAHASLADPFCADLGARLVAAGKALGQTVHAGGAYVGIDGPHFSTRAESAIYRSWGATVIGMTAAAEAKLAREAEMAYGLLATVTDYDVWHASEEDVTTALIMERVQQNVEVARKVVWAVLEGLPANWENPVRGSMTGAVVTAKAKMPAQRREDLGPILGDQ
jgi:5'-methylthioadenosine phosphorylase